MRTMVTSKVWQLFLAVAFLSMQSASAHIHLASSHDHDGHDHSHSQVVHAHNVASHHIDDFESDPNTHASQIVELCQNGIVKYAKCLSDLEPQAVLFSDFPVCEKSTATSDGFDNTFVFRSFHFHSKLKARAPPVVFPSHV